MNNIDTLKLDLTDACNGRCFFCPYHGVGGEISEQGRRKEPVQKLATEDISEIMRDLGGSMRRVKLSGTGESTLNPEFEDIVRLIKSYRVLVKLITNGTTLTRYADFICEHVDDLAVSIHGSEGTHDQIVGLNGAYANAISGLHKIRETSGNRPGEIKISYILNRDNLDSVDHIMDVSRRMGIQVIFYFDFNPQAHEKMDIDCLLEAVRKIQKNGFHISPSLDELGIRRFFSDGNYVLSPHACGHISEEVEVMATGDVCVCRSAIWGNVHETGIINIINGHERQAFLNTITQELNSQEGLDARRCDRCCYQHPPILQ